MFRERRGRLKRMETDEEEKREKQPKERKIIAGRYPRLVEMLPVGGV